MIADLLVRWLNLRPLKLTDLPDYQRIDREIAHRRARHKPTRDLTEAKAEMTTRALRGRR